MEKGSHEREDAEGHVVGARSRTERKKNEPGQEIVKRRARVNTKAVDDSGHGLPGNAEREDLVGPKGPLQDQGETRADPDKDRGEEEGTAHRKRVAHGGEPPCATVGPLRGAPRPRRAGG